VMGIVIAASTSALVAAKYLITEAFAVELYAFGVFAVAMDVLATPLLSARRLEALLVNLLGPFRRCLCLGRVQLRSCILLDVYFQASFIHPCVTKIVQFFKLKDKLLIIWCIIRGLDVFLEPDSVVIQKICVRKRIEDHFGLDLDRG